MDATAYPPGRRAGTIAGDRCRSSPSAHNSRGRFPDLPVLPRLILSGVIRRGFLRRDWSFGAMPTALRGNALLDAWSHRWGPGASNSRGVHVLWVGVPPSG